MGHRFASCTIHHCERRWCVWGDWLAASQTDFHEIISNFIFKGLMNPRNNDTRPLQNVSWPCD